MELIVNLFWLINWINDNCDEIRILKDEKLNAYYILYENGIWEVFDEENPQFNIIDDLAIEYWAMLYDKNKFSDVEWESRKHCLLDNNNILFKIDLEDNRDIILP